MLHLSVSECITTRMGKRLASSIEQTLKGLLDFHYPRYDELPEGLVFLDTIVKLVNRSHAPIPFEMRKNRKLFTSSMASNYIKQGLTPPPVGKKYTRYHVCRIYFAAMMKLVFSTDNVLALTERLFTEENAAAVNDALAETFEQSIACYARYGLAALGWIDEPVPAPHANALALRAEDPVDEGDAPWSELAPEAFMLVNFVADTFAAKAASVAMLGGAPVEE